MKCCARFVLAGVVLAVALTPLTPARSQDLDSPHSGVAVEDMLDRMGYEDPLATTDEIPQRRRGVYIHSHEIDVEIRDLVAITNVTEVFRNPTPFQLEATFRFYLPEGTALDGFSMTMNGQPVQGELLDANRAREIYEGIVRDKQDPGLLQFVGRQMFQARIFPVVPDGDTTIHIRYTQLLKPEAGIVRYRYPLNTSKYNHSTVERLRVTARVHSDAGLRTVYSPTHAVTTDRKSARDAVATFGGRDVVSDRDFLLFFSRGGEDIDLSLISWRESVDTDGYFMLAMSPRIDARAGQADKDIAFVLDTSGSMAGEKMAQARDALVHCLGRLRPADRFSIVAFESVIRAFNGGELHRASPDTIQQAIRFVRGLEAAGGTNIEGALKTATAGIPRNTPGEGRPSMMVFLTDGCPTIGNQNVDDLVSLAAAAKETSTRIFTFGVGHDVNTHLLDRIASTTGGARTYIEPGENIELKVSAFYTKVASPVLTRLRLAADGGQIHDVWPRTLPDLFVGSHVVLFGRYKGDAPPRISLTGSVGDKELTFRTPAPRDVPDVMDNTGNAFIARLWAIRKIGHLLDEIRLHGETDDAVETVTALGKRYGIVTPYTSFLVTEDTPPSPRTVNPGATGRDAVTLSKELDAMQNQSRIIDPAISARVVERQDIDGKTFIRKGHYWIDTAFDRDVHTDDARVSVFAMSEAYFALLRDQPALARWASVGTPAVIVHEDIAYVIEPKQTPTRKRMLRVPLDELESSLGLDARGLDNLQAAELAIAGGIAARLFDHALPW